MTKKLFLIDVDCGVDDAQALMMALAAPEVEILGITCCFGNTTIEHVCRNVLRVLHVCNRMEIPVYRGVSHSLLGEINPEFAHFGGDGLGDAGDPNSPGLEHLQQEDAVHAMIRIINQYQDQVSLIALGPLTNVALAIKLDPSIPKKLHKLYIMGGNLEGRGNRTVCAEFNFCLDPEAAYIVMNEFTCPTYIATLDFSRANSLTMEYFKDWVNQDTAKAKFMKTITARWPQKDSFVSYDSYAVAAAIDESIITESLECAVSVELQGHYTRGMMVLDSDEKLKKNHKVTLMKKANLEKFKQRLWSALA
ncbi:inosine-uridine preferring nucleoside hydrolase-like [Pelobates cultripes]|uniref:Inosine-uridine preferring nucleoside hydrolase-like n=1 Tax=Pelobates cultripes TaxID=61616 RepID=A0AAD1R6P3_PELCU|nr:inosine-uridine preferring nucleoside hydrolase-like [Pelobates cultripes]